MSSQASNPSSTSNPLITALIPSSTSSPVITASNPSSSSSLLITTFNFSTASSTAITAQPAPVPVSKSANKIGTKPKGKKKNEVPTSPKSFPHEQTKIELDILRTKLKQTVTSLKDSNDMNSILTSRNKLFEEKRDLDAHANLFSGPSPQPSPPDLRTASTQPPPPPAAPVSSPAAPPSSASQTFELLIQLELKSLRPSSLPPTSSPTPAPCPSPPPLLSSDAIASSLLVLQGSLTHIMSTISHLTNQVQIIDSKISKLPANPPTKATEAPSSSCSSSSQTPSNIPKRTATTTTILPQPPSKSSPTPIPPSSIPRSSSTSPRSATPSEPSGSPTSSSKVPIYNPKIPPPKLNLHFQKFDRTIPPQPKSAPRKGLVATPYPLPRPFLLPTPLQSLLDLQLPPKKSSKSLPLRSKKKRRRKDPEHPSHDNPSITKPDITDILDDIFNTYLLK